MRETMAALPDDCRSAFMLAELDATSDRGVAAAADLAEALAAEAPRERACRPVTS